MLHLYNILFQKTSSNLKFEMDYPALVIIDQFKQQYFRRVQHIHGQDICQETEMIGYNLWMQLLISL